MPQVDLETLVSACAGGSCGGDSRIACETLAAADHSLPENSPDFPPESFWLSKDAELDWLSQNAFIERKDSGKRNSNLIPNPSSNPGSQRYSLNFKPKASIIGLPKPQKSQFVDKNRKKSNHATARLFPKQCGSGRKSDGLIEPSSPKVSCMGRVRSRRDRRRRSKGSRREKRRKSFLASFCAIFRAGRTKKSDVATGKNSAGSPPREGEKKKTKNDNTHDILSRLPPGEIETLKRSAGNGDPRGLGGMKRFASGRKSDSWLDDDVLRS